MPKRSDNPKLILVCGLPGSGKTTYARKLEASLGAIRFCPDEWMQALALDLYDEDRRARIEAFQWQFGQNLLAQGVSIIIEWGTWGRSERDTLRLGAQSLQAGVELHYLSAPLDVLFERIQRRAMENPPITREDLLRWSELFQAPTPEEMALFDNYVAVEPIALPEPHGGLEATASPKN
jgi:predicted kinase